MPAVHRHQLERKLPRLVQCAERVWGITQGEDKDRAAQAIDRMEAFFQSVGVPTRLSAYNVDADEAAPLVAERLARRGVKIGEYGDLGEQAVREIVMLAR
jgi:NADP-dependent alcohol dehydrogenase